MAEKPLAMSDGTSGDMDRASPESKAPSGGWRGLRRLGRGAPPPAKPYFFVRRHHVFRIGWAFGGWDVVPHRPQNLISSSGSTTSFGLDGPSAAGTWCPTARKALFLRPEAPRLSSQGPPDAMGRGVSLPAKPYFFVWKHHVFRLKGRCLHEPECSPALSELSLFFPDGMRWETARPFPLSPHKERNSAGREARCCSFIIYIFSKKRKNRRLPNFPGSFPPSIFSAGELNFCVRDGNRCILSAIITGFSLFIF